VSGSISKDVKTTLKIATKIKGKAEVSKYMQNIENKFVNN